MTLPTSALSSPRWLQHRPPHRQPATLDRARLTQLLEHAVASNRVTIVSAPSGFGKTIAVTTWTESVPNEVAWLALGPMEGEHAYVDGEIISAIAAIARTRDDLGLVGPVGVDAGTAAQGELHRRLWEALADAQEPLILVVDDAQRAHESLAAGLLGALIADAPPALRIVLVGTTPLELQMSRFILSNPEVVIGAEALAFEAPEVAALAATMSTGADPVAVHADTAGWPIAVRLALLSGAGPRAATSGRGGGLMREYVRDVILSALPADLARFVMEAAVCDELTPRLAVALTGRADAVAMLEDCRRLGLFLDRHDSPTGPVYQWHSLFARYCRDLLAQEDPAALEVLRRRAATLLAEARPLDAVAHLLAVDDPAAATAIILDSWVALVAGAEAGDVDSACLSLPAPFGDDPAIQLVRACACDVMGERKAGRDLFRRATAGTHDPDERFERTLELARLFLLDERALIGEATEDVRRRLVHANARSAREQAAITFLIGWADLRYRMDPTRMIETLESAVRQTAAVGDAAILRRARGCLAFSLALAGRLESARAVLVGLADDDPEESIWQTNAGATALTASGLVSYWAMDTAAAERDLRSAIAFGSGHNRTFADLARVLLACAAASGGDQRSCRRAALELQFLPSSELHGVVWPKMRQLAIALLEEAVGHHDRAVAVARGFIEESSTPLIAVLAAGILRRSGDPTAALQILKHHAAYGEVTYLRVATLVTRAMQHWTAGRAPAAHELCEEALAVAEKETMRIPFAEDDAELRQLLGAHIAWGTAHEKFLMSCLRPKTGSTQLAALSVRERDVFEQLRTTLTTTEIASRLGVSVNTVKTHQRAIYRKLGVSSRREALRQYT
ncbi:LuxR C-terminal-related transcriptional regulator [Microbacterium sp. P5_E9]